MDKENIDYQVKREEILKERIFFRNADKNISGAKIKQNVINNNKNNTETQLH